MACRIGGYQKGCMSRERDVEARIEEQKVVTFKPGCNLTEKDLFFNEVIEVLNDPNDEMHINKYENLDMDIDGQ